jgi:transcriptional regulator with XRE-family HTH domain
MAGKPKKREPGLAPDGTPWAEKIKTLREACGLSQRELATKTGVHHVTIARIETGEQLPRGKTLWKLAEFLKSAPKLPNL